MARNLEMDPVAVPWSRLWLRRARVRVAQAARLVDWVARPDRFVAPPLESGDAPGHLLLDTIVPIARADPDADPILEAGKRINVALAAPAFDGRVVAFDRPLSFWRTLGRVREADGYRHGMELRAGCIVPAIGGGICLISNVMFGAAAWLGWTILERHGHSLEAVPPAPGELWGLDATVLWPHVDLVVAPREGRARISLGVLGGRALRLRVFGDAPLPYTVALASVGERLRGAVRENAVRRTLRAPGGALLGDELIATNRRRILEGTERRRNCLGCGESTCRSRPRSLPVVS